MRYRVALFAMLVVTAAGIGALLWSDPSVGPRTGIDSVRFDTTGWSRFDVSFSSMMWKNADGDILELKALPEFPNDIAVDGDPESMRTRSRQLAASKGGRLVDAEVTTVAGRTAGALVYEVERPSERSYIGMFFVRNEADHFVFSVVSRETGAAGKRDAAERVRATLRSIQQTLAFE